MRSVIVKQAPPHPISPPGTVPTDLCHWVIIRMVEMMVVVVIFMMVEMMAENLYGGRGDTRCITSEGNRHALSS